VANSLTSESDPKRTWLFVLKARQRGARSAAAFDQQGKISRLGEHARPYVWQKHSRGT